MAALTTYPLEGDGIIENLYYYLWCRDEMDNSPSIQIPDTIIYKYRQPHAWYFTAKDGRIKKKHKGSMVNVKIEEAMCRKATGSDIVAYYISTHTEDEDPEAADALTTIEYFNRETFHDFLYHREKVNDGMVQRFVEPKSVQNHMIRCIWSPKICLLERRLNKYNLQDRRYGMYERAVTYEGAEFYSEVQPVRGALLPSGVQTLVEDAVSHVAEVSFQKYKISRLVGNFKVDSRDRLTLLWASSLRLEGETFAPRGAEVVSKGPVNIDTVVRVPRDVRLGGKGFDGGSYTCPGCGLRKPVEQKYPVQYRTIITHFEQLLALLQRELRIKQELTGNAALEIEWPPAPEVILAWGGGSSVGFPEIEAEDEDGERFGAPTAEEVEIPPVLRKLHPRLLVSDYRRYKNDPLYMFKTTCVCEDCMLVYAEVMNTSSIEPEVQPLSRVGGGGDSAVYGGASMSGGGGAGGGASSRRLPPSAWQVEMQRATMEEQRRSRGGRSGGASRRAGRGLASRMQLEVPALPDRVLSAHDAGVVLSAHDTQQYQQQAQQSLSQSVSQLHQQQELDAGGSSQSVSQLPSLKDREESFFKDLYRNPNLQNGHPLSHLIASQSKLEQVAIGSPGAGAGSKSRRRGGRKGGGGAAGPSPYNVVQKVVVNEGAAARRRNRKARRNQPPLPTFKDYSAFGLEGEGEGEGEQGGGTKTAGGKGRTAGKGKGRGKGGPQQQPGDMAVSESAAKHREFLLNTLQDVQQQLDNPPPLLEEPAAPSASAGGGGAAAELSSLSAPAPYATEKSAGASDSSGERSGGVGAGSSSMSQASGPESELKVRLGHTVSGESCTVAFTGRFDSGTGELEAVVTHVPSGNRAEVLGLALPVAAKDAGTFKDYCGKTLEKLQISVGADGSLDASFRG